MDFVTLKSVEELVALDLSVEVRRPSFSAPCDCTAYHNTGASSTREHFQAERGMLCFHLAAPGWI